MKLGIIARYDEGGLGTQTWEYARHLKPHAVLMVDVDPPRGEPVTERFSELGCQLFWSHFPPEDGQLQAWRNFAAECDVILTAEDCYVHEFPEMCAAEGTRLVMHANPELWHWGEQPPFDVWAPTSWLSQLLPDARVVPMPVDRERCAPQEFEAVSRIYHPSAPAMLDRNGTLLVAAALPHCKTKFELFVSGPEAPPAGSATVGNVTIWRWPAQREYWSMYVGMHAMVLPRRYGGLCLPMQEAASCGLPVIATGVAPQKEWLLPALALHEHEEQRARMRGGIMSVWTCEPTALAAAIDSLVSGEQLELGRKASEEFASSIDWQVWEPQYRELLGL